MGKPRQKETLKFCVYQSQRWGVVLMLGFGALFGGMEGRGCWGPALGEERDGQSEILCRGEQ